MITGRELTRDEIAKIWEIDRGEVIEAVFHFEHYALILKTEHWDMQGWPPGEATKYTPILTEPGNEVQDKTPLRRECTTESLRTRSKFEARVEWYISATPSDIPSTFI